MIGFFGRAADFTLRKVYKYVIREIIGEYLVDDLDDDQISVELHAGMAELRDVKLDCVAVGKRIPIFNKFLIQSASAKRVLIRVPYETITTEGCLIEVEDLMIQLEPHITSTFTSTKTNTVHPPRPTAPVHDEGGYDDVQAWVEVLIAGIHININSIQVKLVNSPFESLSLFIYDIRYSNGLNQPHARIDKSDLPRICDIGLIELLIDESCCMSCSMLNIVISDLDLNLSILKSIVVNLKFEDLNRWRNLIQLFTTTTDDDDDEFYECNIDDVVVVKSDPLLMLVCAFISNFKFNLAASGQILSIESTDVIFKSNSNFALKQLSATLNDELILTCPELNVVTDVVNRVECLYIKLAVTSDLAKFSSLISSSSSLSTSSSSSSSQSVSLSVSSLDIIYPTFLCHHIDKLAVDINLNSKISASCQYLSIFNRSNQMMMIEPIDNKIISVEMIRNVIVVHFPVITINATDVEIRELMSEFSSSSSSSSNLGQPPSISVFIGRVACNLSHDDEILNLMLSKISMTIHDSKMNFNLMDLSMIYQERVVLSRNACYICDDDDEILSLCLCLKSNEINLNLNNLTIHDPNNLSIVTWMNKFVSTVMIESGNVDDDDVLRPICIKLKQFLISSTSTSSWMLVLIDSIELSSSSSFKSSFSCQISDACLRLTNHSSSSSSLLSLDDFLDSNRFVPIISLDYLELSSSSSMKFDVHFGLLTVLFCSDSLLLFNTHLSETRIIGLDMVSKESHDLKSFRNEIVSKVDKSNDDDRVQPNAVSSNKDDDDGGNSYYISDSMINNGYMSRMNWTASFDDDDDKLKPDHGTSTRQPINEDDDEDEDIVDVDFASNFELNEKFFGVSDLELRDYDDNDDDDDEPVLVDKQEAIEDDQIKPPVLPSHHHHQVVDTGPAEVANWFDHDKISSSSIQQYYIPVPSRDETMLEREFSQDDDNDDEMMKRRQVTMTGLMMIFRFFNGIDFPINDNSSSLSSLDVVIVPRQLTSTRDSLNWVEVTCSKISANFTEYSNDDDDNNDDDDGSNMVHVKDKSAVTNFILSTAIKDLLVANHDIKHNHQKILGFWKRRDLVLSENLPMIFFKLIQTKQFKRKKRNVDVDDGLHYRVMASLLPIRIHLTPTFLQKFHLDIGKPKPSSSSSSWKDKKVIIRQYDANTKHETTSSSSTSSSSLIDYVHIAPLVLKIFYHPDSINIQALRDGDVLQLLNMFPMEGLELQLPLTRLSGLPSFAFMFESILTLWIIDVSEKQIHKIVQGTCPFGGISRIGGGLGDLILLPLEELKKPTKSRRKLLKSIIKGASSFSNQFLKEILDAGVKSSLYVSNYLNPSMTGQIHNNQPHTLSQALSSSSKSFSNGLSAGLCALLVPHNFNRKKWKFSDLMSAVPIALSKPISGSSLAVSQLMLGLRNYIDPYVHEDEEDFHNVSLNKR